MYEIREYKKAVGCAHGGRLRACSRRLVGQCQYCARGFCDRHGEQFGDREEVCRRPLCQAKRRDLVAHLAFRAAAVKRNGESCCGQPQCEEKPAQDCQRCRADYCAGHLQEHMTTAASNGARGAEVLRLCTHCVERIAIWSQK
jgi:hypothetical protein